MSLPSYLRVSCLAAALGLVLAIVALATGSDVPVPFFVLAFVVAATIVVGGLIRALWRRLLWRVSRRLLVSYLLFGLAPIPLAIGLAFVLLYIVAGQLAVRRVELEIELARHLLANAANELVEVGPGDFSSGQELIESNRGHLIGVGWAFLAREGKVIGSEGIDPKILLPTDRVHTSLEAIGILPGAQSQLLLVERTGDRGTAIAYIAIEPDLRQAIERRARLALSFPMTLTGDGSADFRLDGRGFTIEVGDQDKAETISAGAEQEPGQPEGSKDLEAFSSQPPSLEKWLILGRPMVYWPRTIELPIISWAAEDWHTAIEGDDERMTFIAWTSIALEYGELFRSISADETNTTISRASFYVLFYLAVALVVVYILAGLVAGILVYRIAQASRRLHAGFSAVQAGNFSHRARLRGNDQLSELIASFNHMVGRLEDGMKARAEREAIDRELRVARDLQRSLLPSPNFRAPGFEIAVDFMPAAEIGGDFYDLIEQPDGRLLVAIADVSGHGLSTGIVMSAAKVLLSALIADGCTATKLFERLDREILLMTDRRAFVTLALCAFDPALGKVEFTNAGQVYPYRVTASGRVESLSNPSRPLGVALPARFVTVTADWDVEDLWVLASDAIIEARNRAGEVFGFESFEAALAACAGNSACEARDRILAVWQAFTCCELPEDDRTLIVLRREPTLAAVPDPRATY